MLRSVFRTRSPRAGGERRQRGQALALFVLLMFVLLGMVAVVVDVSWFWSNRLHMQRAADAAALAGAVYLPGDPSTAATTARAEAAKNGYTGGVNGITVTPTQSSTNPRQLNVTISGPVNWTFAQVFNALEPGKWNQTTVTVRAKAQYVLPVPMGSPQNYFGVGYFSEAVTTSTTTRIDADTGENDAGATVSGGSWTNAGNAFTENDAYATEDTNGQAQQWNGFNLDTDIPNEPTLVIDGIQVVLTDVFLTGSGTSTDCQLRVELSRNGGATWSSAQNTSALSTSTTSDRTVGSTTDTSGWGLGSWSRIDFNSSFRVRLTWIDGTASCASTRSVSLDQLEVRVDYHYDDTTTTITAQETAVDDPYGGTIQYPQQFWGAMNSQGAPSVQGDAYMTYYDVRVSSQNSASSSDPDAHYAPDDYYNYGIEIPAGATSGEVWIFDPGFCEAGETAAGRGMGTGEFWTVGGSNGYSSRQPVSAYFDLYHTQGTPYDLGDDTLVASSNNTYRQMDYQDHDLFAADGQTPSQPDCNSTSWHHDWWRLANGLSGGGSGTVYRLHTYSTDNSSPSDQLNTTAHNTFAFWAKASGGTPRIYGIGAMEAYVRLPGNRASEFYLAQIEDVHAGKTLLIDLWDPGDTGNLSASLEILKPTSSAYVPATFTYTAAQGSSSNPSSCNSNTGTNVTAVTTNTGGTSLYNGCWLTISIQLPNDYDAPHPSTDSETSEGGWWKIRYTMGGSTTSFSTDLTTWQVGIRGSPVHLLP